MQPRTGQHPGPRAVPDVQPGRPVQRGRDHRHTGAGRVPAGQHREGHHRGRGARARRPDADEHLHGARTRSWSTGSRSTTASTHPTARYTIAGILANSINDGMVQVVQHVSPQIQYQYFRAFGSAQPTGLNLPGESPGILPPPVDSGRATSGTPSSFGQGVAVTAVQMASVYATIANGGVRVQPSIVAGTTSGSGTFTPAPAPRQTRVIQPKTASELMAILQQVPLVDAAGRRAVGRDPRLLGRVQDRHRPGRGRRGRAACASTGRATSASRPASDPQLVVAVNVQDPTQGRLLRRRGGRPGLLPGDEVRAADDEDPAGRHASPCQAHGR